MSNTHSLYTCSIVHKLWEHLVFWKFQQIQLYSIFQMCPLTCGACVSYHTHSLSFPPPSIHVSVLHSFEYPIYQSAVNISSNQKKTINKMGRDFKPSQTRFWVKWHQGWTTGSLTLHNLKKEIECCYDNYEWHSHKNYNSSKYTSKSLLFIVSLYVIGESDFSIKLSKKEKSNVFFSTSRKKIKPNL